MYSAAYTSQTQDQQRFTMIGARVCPLPTCQSYYKIV